MISIKKKILGLLFVFALVVPLFASNVSAAAPDKYYVVTSSTDRGAYAFYSEYNELYKATYRGYLYRESCIGGACRYSGYIYRAPLPYPIP